MRDLNAEAAKVHELNQKWWVDLETGEPIKRNPGEMCMLIVSEFAECMEGERKDLMDDHLPHRKMAEVELADVVIRVLDIAGAKEYDLKRDPNLPAMDGTENVGESLFLMQALTTQLYIALRDNDKAHGQQFVGVIITACETYCVWRGYDLWAAVDEKNEYNRTRADHQIENRKQEHGKKW